MFTFIVVFITTSFCVSAQEIIVHPSVQEKFISRQTARSVFKLRKKMWSSGERITVVQLPTKHKAHLGLHANILYTDPFNVRDIQSKRIFSGAASKLIYVKSQDEMLKVVSQTPGSIGYIHLQEALDSKNYNLRILKIKE